MQAIGARSAEIIALAIFLLRSGGASEAPESPQSTGPGAPYTEKRECSQTGAQRPLTAEAWCWTASRLSSTGTARSEFEQPLDESALLDAEIFLALGTYKLHASLYTNTCAQPYDRVRDLRCAKWGRIFVCR